MFENVLTSAIYYKIMLAGLQLAYRTPHPQLRHCRCTTYKETYFDLVSSSKTPCPGTRLQFRWVMARVSWASIDQIPSSVFAGIAFLCRTCKKKFWKFSTLMMGTRYRQDSCNTISWEYSRAPKSECIRILDVRLLDQFQTAFFKPNNRKPNVFEHLKAD